MSDRAGPRSGNSNGRPLELTLQVDSDHTWSGRILFVLGPVAFLLFAANAIVFGSIAIYALALCVQLSVALISFYSVVPAASS